MCYSVNLELFVPINFLTDSYYHGDFEQIQLCCPTDNFEQLWQYAWIQVGGQAAYLVIQKLL